MTTIEGGMAIEEGKPLPKKLTDKMDLPFVPSVKEAGMTETERKIVGHLIVGTPVEAIRTSMDVSMAEILLVKQKYPELTKPTEKASDKKIVREVAGAIVADVKPPERPAAVKEIDEKVKPQIVKQGPPRDENAERAKLASVAAGPVVEAKAEAKSEPDKTPPAETGNEDKEPETGVTAINPEDILDQNTRTVLKKLSETLYTNEEIKVLKEYEETHRNRGNVLKKIEKRTEAE